MSSWQDRVREGAYTSPGGARVVYMFEDVSRETDKRTALFEFPDVDGAFVQDNGFGARLYPLRCYFSGDSHDLAATTFEVALLERGPGRLDHPFYGSFNAIPFGRVSRRDDLKTAANQSVVEVTFFAVIADLYPSGLASPRNELIAALIAFDLASSEEFADLTNVSTAAARAATKAKTRSLIKLVEDSLGALSGAVTSVDSSFRDAQSALNYGLDLLVGQPLQLAQQVINLIQAPARARIGIEMRLAGYRDFSAKLFGQSNRGSSAGSNLPGPLVQRRNSFRASDLFAQQSAGGAIRAAYETTFTEKPTALATAFALLVQFDDLVAWRDDNLSGLVLSDPGRAQQALRHAVARSAAYLIDSSYSLATERVIVLDRPRTIVDLAGELFGSVDDRLDALIAVNNLTGSEILELPRGAAIAYYQ